MAMSLKPSENGVQLGYLRSNTYHMVKIWLKTRPVNPEFFLLKRLVKKEK